MSLLLFKKHFLDPVRAGRKKITIRRWDRPRVYPGRRAFAPGLGWLFIQAVDVVTLRDLNERDAKADGFINAAEMRRQLRKIYPAYKGAGKRWLRVRFKIATPARRTGQMK